MNGPVSCTGEEPVWERPWSLEEIRRSSHSWSLGADAGLLNFLKEFSQQTISRTHEIEKQLDGLVREVKTTDCRLHNVFNDFLMLSNTQFIENRVYDEEVEEHIIKPEQGEKPEQEKTREQKEAELIPKIQEAVNYGLQVLETAFEQLDIKAGNSDSEDEEVNERVELILEPKDLYIDRPLPFLIGSQLFMQQEDVGLGDLSSEEGSVDIDRGSVIDSEEEEDEEEEEKDNEEESEEDFGNNSEEEKKLRTALSDEDEDNGSDLFGESDKEDEEENDTSAKSKTKSFADELAARIQAEIPKRLDADASSISSDVKTKKEKEKKEVKKLPSDDEDDDMFKPPKLTDEDFFGNKGGLFSGGKGLFDDEDDEEGDLFSDLHTKESKPAEPIPVTRPETLPSDVKKKPPYGGVSLFPGGENVINPSILADKDKRKPATPTDVAPKPVTNTSLFDDDDVMFGGSPPAQPAAKAKPAADLFADDDDLFNDRPSMPPATVPKNKVVADLDKKNIQMPTEKPQPPERSGKKHAKGLFSDEEDSESDLFLPSQTANKPKTSTSAAPANKTSKALSLFDDEDEDLFGTGAESKSTPVATKPAPQPVLPAASKTQKSALFNSDKEEPVKVSDDIKAVEKNRTDLLVPPKTKEEEKTEKKSSLFDGHEEDDLFAITKESQKKHHRVSLLFEEDENSEEPLFSSAGSTAKSTGHTLEQSKTVAPVKVDTEKVSLFDDVDKKSESKAPVLTKEDAAPPAVQISDKVKSVSVKESDDLFSDTPPTLKHTKTKSTNVLSLFGEEDDEDMEDQLSTSASSKDSETVPVEKNTQAKRSTRVFQDEELLFSQELQKDNDPDVDLFASTSKKATEKPNTVKPPDGLFGDEDEDDLFSPVKPSKEKKIVIKKENLDPPKEPSRLNVIKKETISKADGGEKPTEPAPVKSKSPSSRIGKLQANLHINPAALLPGAVPKLSGARHPVPEAHISDLPVAESSRSSDVSKKSVEGVSFETPAQVDPLHSANKSRAKVGGKRRPPTRMGRKHASQDSGEAGSLSDTSPISPTHAASLEAAHAQSNWQPDIEEPISTMKLSFSENDVQSRTRPKAHVNPLTPDVNDLFGSDLFGSSSLPDPVTSRQNKKLPASDIPSQPREEENKATASVFDAEGSDDDLFKSSKEKHKTFKSTSLLDNEPEDDLFGGQKPQKKVDVQPVPPKDIKATTDIFEDDIFAAEAIKPVKKPKEKKTTSEANLFDDHSDIFADLTQKPKIKNLEKKSKKKVEAKSIFDDDMDDIFSTSVSSTKKSKPKAKSTPTSETKQDIKASSMFDDPLNVLGK